MTQVLRPLVEARTIREPRPDKPSTMTFGKPVPTVVHTVPVPCDASLVRKTWPMLSRQNVQPENPEKATYTMSGSLRSTPMELIVRPVGRVAAFVRSVQAGELESAFVVLWILLVVPNASVPT